MRTTFKRAMSKRGRLAQRLAAAGLSASLLISVAGPVAATNTLDFGDVDLGDSSTLLQPLPLIYRLSEIPVDTVVYAGGNATIDSILGSLGLTAPVTAGALYGAIGEVTATYRASLSVPSGSDFSIDNVDCGTASGACSPTVTFTPTAVGTRTAAVTVSVTNVSITGGGIYGSLLDFISDDLISIYQEQLMFSATGVGVSSSGGLTLEVDVPAAPVPCLIVDASFVDFGTLPFSTGSQLSTASRAVTVTSCSTGPEAILARGTDAVGDGEPAAAWALSAAGGNPCTAGVDQFGIQLTGDPGSGLAVLQLSTGASPWLTLATEAAAPTTVDYQMPCEGSSGAGQTMTSQITFLATAP